MNSLFRNAAASYFGMNPDQVPVIEFNSDENMNGYFSFRIPASDEDMAGIVDRMRVMQAQDSDPEPTPEPEYQPTVAEWRERWDMLSANTQSKFGSFGRYMSWGGELQP